MSADGRRDRAAIVGVGYTPYSRASGVSTFALALRAIRAALDDAGLTNRDVDGVACHRMNDSVGPEVVAQALGITDLKATFDVFGGGSASVGTLGQAVTAVTSGQAECVVVWRAINGRSGIRLGGTGWTPPGMQLAPYTSYRHMAPPQGLGMFIRPFLVDRGIVAEDLGRVAIIHRDHARLSPRSMMTTPLTMDDYLASRWIVDPLRLFDCCLETDAAVALVVTSTERARDLVDVPVTVSAVTVGGGSTLMSNGLDLTEVPAARLAPRLYREAGVGPDELDLAQVYDAYTPLVHMTLEAFGICKRGESAELVASGATRLGGRIPTNTSGGHLSEGYVHGLNLVAEAVNQLRGRCGERQVPDARVALAAGQPGIGSGYTAAAILKRGD